MAFPYLVSEIHNGTLAERIQEVNDMMRDKCQLLLGHLVRHDIQTLVHLHGVGAYDLTPQFVRQLQRQFGFPRASRAQNDDDRKTVRYAGKYTTGLGFRNSKKFLKLYLKIILTRV